MRGLPLALAAAVAGLSPGPAAATTRIVNTTGDPGPAGTLSLRQAIEAANNLSASDTITFDASLTGSTITLTGGYILIQNGMTISGPGADKLTISGNHLSRLFIVDASFLSPVTMHGLTLTGGAPPSPQYGGAIAASYSSLSLEDCVIAGNSAVNGGGVMSGSSYVTLLNTRISNNHAEFSGGGIMAKCGTGAGACGSLTIEQSTISGNTAGQYGAGLFAYAQSLLQIADSTINGNRLEGAGAASGGGIWIIGTDSTPLLEYSTVAGNYSANSGGGISTDAANLQSMTIAGNSTQAGESNGLEARGVGTVTLQNGILANNFSSHNTIDLTGSITANYSLIRNAGSATVGGTSKLIGLDPQLGPLGDHGGPTLTMVPAGASPIVDAGESGLPPTTDQRGYTRPVGAKVDMGAVERQPVEDIVFRDRFEGI